MPYKRGEGGRPKGVRNKSSADITDLIDQLTGPGAIRCFEELARIAFGSDKDVRARLLANRTLIEYRHGQPRKQVELTGAEGGPIQHTVKFVKVSTAA